LRSETSGTTLLRRRVQARVYVLFSVFTFGYPSFLVLIRLALLFSVVFIKQNTSANTKAKAEEILSRKNSPLKLLFRSSLFLDISSNHDDDPKQPNTFR